ncbi:MAG TPA: patatin-like phospholipase family protein [Caulobacteraceae bacterium]
MAFRVLALDGGGTWALIQVKALIALYDAKTSGHQVLMDFDLVAANSGGSIVLGGLVEDVTLGALLDFFEIEQNRRAIFSPTGKILDVGLKALTGLGPRYSAEAKLPALERLLPNRGPIPLSSAALGVRRTGSNLDVHLLITAFDYDRNRAAFFRSAPAGGVQWGMGGASDATLAEAIHASTNAPVNYFDEPAAFAANRYWDGAIAGYNNPVLAAVTEAIMLGVQPTDIAALSIGTGTTALAGPPIANPPTPFVQATTNQSVVDDLRKLAGSIVDDPPDVATFLAHVMTGGGAGVTAPAQSRIVRLNPLISPLWDPQAGAWKAPGSMTTAQFKYFANIDMDAIDPNQVAYITSYAASWLANLAPNQPMRMNGDTLAPELGYASFADALAAWREIK